MRTRKCKMAKTDWAAFLFDGRGEEPVRPMAEHVETCPECRAEAEGMRKVLEQAGAVRDEIHDALDSVDWEALPGFIADRTIERARREAGGSSPERGRGSPWPLRLRPALAGLAAGLAIGAAAMYLALRSPSSRGPEEAGYLASAEFLDRAELELARRVALDYLRRSQYILHDVLESAERGSPVFAAALGPEQARELLAKKKYLNAQLERFQMAKAKALCDQIEMLFLELAEVSPELTGAELQRIKGFVEERQLLLKINLIAKELESET